MQLLPWTVSDGLHRRPRVLQCKKHLKDIQRILLVAFLFLIASFNLYRSLKYVSKIVSTSPGLLGRRQKAHCFLCLQVSIGPGKWTFTNGSCNWRLKQRRKIQTVSCACICPMGWRENDTLSTFSLPPSVFLPSEWALGQRKAFDLTERRLQVSLTRRESAPSVKCLSSTNATRANFLWYSNRKVCFCYLLIFFHNPHPASPVRGRQIPVSSPALNQYLPFGVQHIFWLAAQLGPLHICNPWPTRRNLIRNPHGQKFRQWWTLLQIILSSLTQNKNLWRFKTMLPCCDIFGLCYVQKSWSIEK